VGAHSTRWTHTDGAAATCYSIAQRRVFACVTPHAIFVCLNPTLDGLRSTEIIELDLRPNGHLVRAFVGVDRDGNAPYEERELDEGDVIAHGTAGVEGYGTTPVERAKFIVDTIRVHFTREACTLHVQDLSSIEALLGREVRWCPACDIRLTTE
jgi:hypothetical protein